MKNGLKRILALALAMALCLGLGAAALASEAGGDVQALFNEAMDGLENGDAAEAAEKMLRAAEAGMTEAQA